MSKIFISYSRADADFARKLRARLLEVLDVDEIYVGDTWSQQVTRAIQESNSVIFLMNAEVSKSYYETEVRYALGLGKRVIPILSEDAELPEILGIEQHLETLRVKQLDLASDPRIIDRIRELLEQKGDIVGGDRATSLAKDRSELLDDDKKEEIAFTHFYPAEVALYTEAPLHVYIHLASVINQVREDFERRKSFQSTPLSDTVVSDAFFKRGTIFKIVPAIKNTRVIPSDMNVEWLDDYEHVQFSVKPDQKASVGTGCSGYVQIYVGIACIAQLPVIFRVGEQNSSQIDSETRFPYKRIFISYAHEDQAVVKAVDRLYAKYPGFRTLIDYKILREGQDWWQEAMKHIGEAEALQLFWSQHAAKSEPVEREWTYALGLPRPIVPIMLKPEAPIPDRLKDIIFGDFDRFIDNL